MAWPTAVQVELAIATDPTSNLLVFDDTTRGLFNHGTFAPAGGAWTDVSAAVSVQSISTQRGRARLFESYNRGTMTVVFDDPTGLLTPHNTLSAYYPYLRPEVRIRASVTVGGTKYPIFQGYVKSFLPQFPSVTGGPRTCTISVVDGFDVLARYDPPAASSPVGDGDTAGARIGRLLDLAQWPAGDRVLDTGLSTMQSTTLAQNVLTELQLTTDSEGGELFIDAQGRVVFRDRHDRYESTNSNTVQATFTDTNDTTLLHYESLDVPQYDDELVKNSVSIAAVGDTAQTSSDATSQAHYFVRTWNRHDLIHDGGDTQSQGLADREVFFYKDPEQRVDGIRLKGMSGSPAGLWTAMYGLDFGHRIRAVQTLTADDLDKQLFVEGISHTIEPGYKFETTLQTSSATAVDAGMFIFDSATLGKFDTNTLAPV